MGNAETGCQVVRLKKFANEFSCLTDLEEKCQSIEDLALSDDLQTIHLSKDVILTVPQVSVDSDWQ